MLYRLAKPLLFSLDPETAHNATIRSLAHAGQLPLPGKPVADPVELMGIRFANRVGLAAGLDKNAEAVQGLQALGFGFLEVGTVTPKPQAGNPRPRLFRLTDEQGIINRMGFNNEGLAALTERVAKLREAGRIRVPLGINIGMNKTTPAEKSADDYRAGLRAAAPLADYITVNLSSPNTPGLRDLQFGQALTDLLNALVDCRAGLPKSVPMLLKVAPDMAEEDLLHVTEQLAELGFDGMIVSNTTVARETVAANPLAEEAGGLSGRPLFAKSTEALRVVAKFNRSLQADKRLVLIGVGGIDSPDTAVEKIRAGADLVQMYSGLIYQGPGLVRRAAKAIAKS